MCRLRFISAIISLFAICQTIHAERSDIILNQGWRFQQGDPAGAETVSFDDGGWQAIDVPHTWNRADEPQTASKSSRYLRGPGWYRRTFEFSEKPAGKRTFLRFEAASMVADVYLNGTRLGQHRGGFTAFTFEITDTIRPGTNLLAVCVDNSGFGDVPPLSGDFTIFGGIYRPVHLLQTGPLCISPLIHGGRGVSILQSNVSREQATVAVKTHISDKGGKAGAARLRTSIIDASGKVTATLESDLPPGADAKEQTLVVRKPRLWDGVNDPYLYTVRVEVSVDGKVVDHVTEPFGLRFFNFDRNQGFTLNGRPYRLHGVCRHQDYGNKGWAVSEADQEEDMALIREMGANAVRLAHYPHSDSFLRLCDRRGVIAWSEIPLVDAIGKADGFADNAVLQLQEMIAQLGNHPSIVTWGLWNELQGGAPALPLIQKLNDLAHTLDSTRPTTAASFAGSQKWCPDATKVTDLLAINTYPGWYRGTPDGMADSLENFRKFATDQPLGVSEYGAGASIDHHQQGMTQGPPPRAWWHPEEWQASCHEAHWKHIESRPFIWGSFVWCMFDFASAGRSEGDMIGINDKGLVTRDRKIRKDAFYFYKAMWSEDPVLHINSRRHALRTEAHTPLKVYSNAGSLKLSLNGVPLPPARRDGVVYTWDDIALQKGANIIAVTAEHQGRPVSDWLMWYCDPDGGTQ